MRWRTHCSVPLFPQKQIVRPFKFTIEEGAVALTRLAPETARGAVVDVDVALQGGRTAPVAPLAIPCWRDLVMKVATHNLSVSRQLRQTIFGLWRTDLTYL